VLLKIICRSKNNKKNDIMLCADHLACTNLLTVANSTVGPLVVLVISFINFILAVCVVNFRVITLGAGAGESRECAVAQDSQFRASEFPLNPGATIINELAKNKPRA
jgi:hypothetical protein